MKACTQIPGEEGALRLVAGLARSNMHLHDTQVFSSAKLRWCFGQDPG